MSVTIVSASQSLLYLEGQGVAGLPADSMQQTSVGFDYLSRLSSENGDWGSVALQGRLNVASNALSSQLYNATVKLKTAEGDVWVGHDKPAMGLSTWVDNHAWLLADLSMKGFGLDRDWGIGLTTQRSDGDDRYSLTKEAGLAGRRSWGVLNQDNSTIGMSAIIGNMILVGVDHAANWDNFEWVGDAFWGRVEDQPAYALMGRLSCNLLDENKLKLDIQQIVTDLRGQALQETSLGLTYLINSDWTARLIYQDNQVGFQGYYYARIL